MRIFRICLCFLLSTSVILAENSKKLTVREIIDDPGLDARTYRQKQFTWTPKGDGVLFLEKNKNQNCDLLKFSINSLKIDTVFTYEQLRWSNDTHTVQLDPFGFISAPDGFRYLLTGENDLFLGDERDGTIVRLTNDGTQKSVPKFSPNGKWVSYICDHNIWIVNCESRSSLQLTTDGNESIFNGESDWVYTEEFDFEQAYQWSPDSKMIAYCQLNENGVSRYPLVDWSPMHPEIEWQYYPNAGEKIPEVKVFTVDIETQKIVCMNNFQSKNEYIVRIDWLADTSLVVIQSINRLQNNQKVTYGNPRTGQTKVILEEKDPYWLNITDLYYFMKNSRNFIYYSEIDNFMHLYLYDFEGNLIKPITSGDWMVTELNGVNEKDSLVYFTATKNSVLERHIYSVHLGSGAISQIDSGDGVHSAVFSPDLKYYLDFFSNVNSQVDVRIIQNNGRKITDLYHNNDFSPQKYNFGVTRFIKIPAIDGDSLYASLLYPSDFDPQKKYPVIVYVYGGPGVQVVQNRYGGAWTQLLTQQGYLIFSLDNRGSYGRGRYWERRIYQQLGKIELQDQLDGVKYLKSLPYIDPRRIGIWGASYGGYMTLYALTKTPEVFKTGIAISPVTDWKYYDAPYTERYLGLPINSQNIYKESAPLNYVNQIKANFLLIHGTYDDNVHLQQSLEFIDELISNNVRFELMLYPGRKHGITDREGQIHMYETFLEFLQRNL